ncbi:DMT family transporter [Streptosporangium sp. NPDC000396]|uniref:DMT family transporter n=1 Tax=Streptosporangium sp. NPDC000396 TaxID=3366185 RepID=UPI00368C4960
MTTTAAPPRSRFLLGAVLCLTAASGFGTAAIYAKESYRAGAGMPTMLTVRFVLAAVFFWALVAWRRPAFPARRTLTVCLALGAVGYACQAAFYFGALTRINASLVSLLLYAYPALVTGIAVALRRESLDRRRVAALACSVSGLLLLLGTGGAGGPGAAGGVLLGLGAAGVYAIYLTVADGLPRDLDLYLLSALVCTGAAVSIAVAALMTGSLRPPAQPVGWPWMAMLALISTVVPVICTFAGVREVGASTAAILSCAEPAVTVASTALVYGERLTLGQLSGGAVILATVFVLKARENGKSLDAPRKSARISSGRLLRSPDGRHGDRPNTRSAAEESREETGKDPSYQSNALNR